MINLTINIDERLLSAIDKACKPLGLNRVQIIEAALKSWLKRREGSLFEQEWIDALKEYPDKANRAEEWLNAQDW
jgi:metal-responsive CopG/Arc/MetJ family transcriptional regulator